MSERSTRGELISWPDPLPEGEGEHDEVILARTGAALVAARNEVALLRARVARLERDNERLVSDLAERSPRKPG